MNYYILQTGETKGPYTIGQLKTMWNSGGITVETLYREELWTEWLPLLAMKRELEPQPIAQHSGKKSGTAKIVRGIIALILGLGVFLWARNHSPQRGFAEILMLNATGGYVLHPTDYNWMLIISALLGVTGMIMIILGLQANQKKD